MLWFTPGHPGFFIPSFSCPLSPTFVQLCRFGKENIALWRCCPLAGEIFTNWAAESKASLHLKKCKCVTTHQDGKIIAAEAPPWLLLMFLLLSAEIFFLSFQIISRKHLLVYLLFWLRGRQRKIVVRLKQERWGWYPQVTESVIRLEPEEKQT